MTMTTMITVITIMLTAAMIMVTAVLITLTTIMIMTTTLIIMIMTTKILTRTVIIINLVSKAFLRRGEGGGGGAENPGIGCSRDFQTPRKVKFNKTAFLNIRGEEFRRQFKCLSAVREFSPHIPVMVIRATTLAPIKKAKRNLLHPIFWVVKLM